MYEPGFKSGRSAGRWLERSLLFAGLLLVTIYAAATLHRVIASHVALRQFEAAQASPVVTTSSDSSRQADVDFSLWSAKRIQHYKQSLSVKNDAALGVLRIPKFGLVVPVFEGTDDLALNRGVGRIAGTANLLDESGNVGIAGHRDGFFRGLKDIQVGDAIELQTFDGEVEYVVRNTEIVAPKDTRVLAPTGRRELTLVTCYPFYFIGSAPQRFIVHAFADGNQSPRTSSQAVPR
jgi:sortase A